MGCGATKDAGSARNGPADSDSQSRPRSVLPRQVPKGKSPENSMATAHMTSVGRGTSLSSITNSNCPQNINGFTIFTMLDSKNCRVTSVIANKSKVESICRYVDGLRQLREEAGCFRNPQECALKPKEGVEANALMQKKIETGSLCSRNALGSFKSSEYSPSEAMTPNRTALDEGLSPPTAFNFVPGTSTVVHMGDSTTDHQFLSSSTPRQAVGRVEASKPPSALPDS